MIPKTGNEINWRKVPREAIVDALKNAASNIVLTHLAQQPKEQLVDLAKQALNSRDASRFLRELEDQIKSRTL